MATATKKPTPKQEERGFLQHAVELSHSWEVTDSKPLTQEEKDSIKEVRVSEGQYGPQMRFSMKDGSTRVMQVSQFCSLKAGDKVRISTIMIDELFDSQDDNSEIARYGQRQ